MMAVTRRIDPEPFWLWIGVNLLNLTDAALTGFAISSGIAREANPVIGMIGFDGKIAAVAVASTLLAMVRPKALLVPLVALGAVVVYTAVGIAIAA